MSKFSIAARIVELGEINAVRSSKGGFAADVKETILQSYLRARSLRQAVQARAEFSAQVDPQAADEDGSPPAAHKASPYDLASNNPYVIAATLFSRKRW